MMTIEEVITKIGDLRSKFGRCSDADYDKEQVIIRNAASLILEDPDLLAILQKARSDAEIVERLPKTADGKAVTPGMTVYPELLHDEDEFPDDGGTVELITIDGEIEIRDSQGEKGPNYVGTHVSNVYSTREAALAAKGA